MKNNILSYIIICVLSIFYSCDKNVHSDEQGVAVALEMSDEDLAEDIAIRIFNSDDIFVAIHNFDSYEDVGSLRLPLTPGDYTFVTTVNINKHFTSTDQISKTTLDDLFFTMNAPYVASSHAHYAVTKVTVSDVGFSQVVIKTNLVFSQLDFTINGLPDDILKAEVIMHNTSKGFYPATHKLSTECNSSYIGEVDIINNVAEFPIVCLMPSVSDTPESDPDAKSTVEFIFIYDNGEEGTVTVTLPKTENGGTYAPELDFDVFKPGVVVNITDIKGWGDGSDNEGEILNPYRQ